MLAHESGEWEQGAELARQLQLKEEEVSDIYLASMQWSRQVTGGE